MSQSLAISASSGSKTNELSGRTQTSESMLARFVRFSTSTTLVFNVLSHLLFIALICLVLHFLDEQVRDQLNLEPHASSNHVRFHRPLMHPRLHAFLHLIALHRLLV